REGRGSRLLAGQRGSEPRGPEGRRHSSRRRWAGSRRPATRAASGQGSARDTDPSLPARSVVVAVQEDRLVGVGRSEICLGRRGRLRQRVPLRRPPVTVAQELGYGGTRPVPRYLQQSVVTLPGRGVPGRAAPVGRAAKRGGATA